MNYFLSLSVFFFLPTHLHAKEWNGLRPLFSNREDVVKKMGNPSNENDTRLIYDLPDEYIYIVLARSEEYLPECIKTLKKGTVLLIKIKPKKKLSMQEMGFDEGVMRIFDPSQPANIGYKGYIDDKEGLVVRTIAGKVDEVNYIVTIEDKKLCPEYYAKPEQFIKILVHFARPEKTKEPVTPKQKPLKAKKRPLLD